MTKLKVLKNKQVAKLKRLLDRDSNPIAFYIVLIATLILLVGVCTMLTNSILNESSIYTTKYSGKYSVICGIFILSVVIFAIYDTIERETQNTIAKRDSTRYNFQFACSLLGVVFLFCFKTSIYFYTAIKYEEKYQTSYISIGSEVKNSIVFAVCLCVCTMIFDSIYNSGVKSHNLSRPPRGLSSNIIERIVTSKPILGLNAHHVFLILSIVLTLIFYKFSNSSIGNRNSIQIGGLYIMFCSIMKLLLPVFSVIGHLQNKHRKVSQAVDCLQYSVNFIVCVLEHVLLDELGTAMTLYFLYPFINLLFCGLPNFKGSKVASNTKTILSCAIVFVASYIGLYAISYMALSGAILLIGSSTSIKVLLVMIVVAIVVCGMVFKNSLKKYVSKVKALKGVLLRVEKTAVRYLGVIGFALILSATSVGLNHFLPALYETTCGVDARYVDPDVETQKDYGVLGNVAQRAYNRTCNYMNYDQVQSSVSVLKSCQLINAFKPTQQPTIASTITKSGTTLTSDYAFDALCLEFSVILAIVILLSGYFLVFMPVLSTSSLDYTSLDKEQSYRYQFLEKLSMIYMLLITAQVIINVLSVTGLKFYTGTILPYISTSNFEYLFLMIESSVFLVLAINPKDFNSEVAVSNERE